jgi:hypothetical protein
MPTRLSTNTNNNRPRRDLALAAHLGRLTSLHLTLRQGPYHLEQPRPGGAAGREGAAALGRGVPGLAALGLVGCSVEREGLVELLGALTGLRRLDLTGGFCGGVGGGAGLGDERRVWRCELRELQ